MKLSRDIEPRNFDFWSGAEERANKLTDEDWDIIEPILDDLYPDGTEDSTLNDLFWFDFDSIAEWLGYKDEEDMDLKRDPHYEPAECDYCGEEYDFNSACYSPITKCHYCCGECQDQAEADFFEDHEDMSLEKIPSWALCYLVNGDATGLSEEDIAIVNDWMKKTKFIDLEVVKYESGDAYTYFTHYPAFGKATDVTDCIIKFKNDDE